MKALKYGLTLMLGLSMLGFSAQAQSSKQTKKVVPSNAQTSESFEAVENAPAAEISPAVAKEPDRGIPTPKAVEELLMQQNYTKAIEEFEKFIATAKGDSCDLLYLPYTFYARLNFLHPSKSSEYTKKMKYYMAEYQRKCSNSVEAYLLKDDMTEPRIPDSTLVWMTKALEIDSTYARIYSIRGEALWQLQRHKEACADFEKAKELNENDSFATEFLRMNCANLPKEEENPAETTAE
ncbi:MAG: tetratricopeptide repeat protein [Bacteroidales bacterium]|nr:tetratricopeptide repeat protein [Bacteroidales bacterium]